MEYAINQCIKNNVSFLPNNNNNNNVSKHQKKNRKMNTSRKQNVSPSKDMHIPLNLCNFLSFKDGLNLS